MAIKKLQTADFTGKGVSGLPDTPNLSAGEMQAKFDELAKDVLTPKINELIDGIAAEEAARVLHEAAQTNPHAVTKEQVGLGSADNTADAEKPVSAAQEARITEKFEEARAVAQAHIANLRNPHGITPDQIGAATPEFVRNLVATAGGNSGGLPSHSLLVNRDNPDQHPIAAISGLTALLEQAEEHRQNTQNPHGVTAQQCMAVPVSRRINGKPLSEDVQLLPSDLGIVLERGTWTPTFLGSTNAGSPSFTTQKGFYVRIGDLVWINCDLQLSDPGGLSGAVSVRGIPFVPAERSVLASIYDYANLLPLNALIEKEGFLRLTCSNTAGSWSTLVSGNVTETFHLNLSGCYAI